MFSCRTAQQASAPDAFLFCLSQVLGTVSQCYLMVCPFSHTSPPAPFFSPSLFLHLPHTCLHTHLSSQTDFLPLHSSCFPNIVSTSTSQPRPSLTVLTTLLHPGAHTRRAPQRPHALSLSTRSVACPRRPQPSSLLTSATPLLTRSTTLVAPRPVSLFAFRQLH